MGEEHMHAGRCRHPKGGEPDGQPPAGLREHLGWLNRRDREIGGRIYLAMPDVQALQELLRLWRRYTENRKMPVGRGPGVSCLRIWSMCGHGDRRPGRERNAHRTTACSLT
jgi:hypothetical protein